MTTSENLTNLSLSQKQALLAKLLQEKERQPEYVPLSFTQQRLWFLDRLMEGSPNYNIPAAVRLKGSVNITALERSIAEIVSRHDSLRTTFALVEGTPMQVIAPAQPLSLPIQDLRSKADPLAEAHRLASFEAQRPFDLAHGPLWRIVLLQIAEADYVLILVMHHIISDGWSVGIFMREMSALYMAFSRNMPPRFTELPIQYADFARWQRQVFNNGNQEIHLNYWKRQLAHAPALSTLPADYTRPPIPTYRGKTVQFQLSTELLSSLSRLSQQSGTTLFMTLLAAFAALLSRYSHQDDLVIGSPIANRTKRETEPLIGFFANTLALRIPLAEDPTFKELLAKVRQITLDAYTHQDTPFSMLVEELQLERDLSYTPLFQVMFVLQNQPMQPVKLPDLSLEPIELDIGTAKFDLTMAVTETENGLVGTVEYSTDLFTKATIDRLLKHFERLLWDVTANPEQPLSQISLLAAAEAQEILVEWNKTEESYPQVDCLPYLFEQQVAATSEATAVAFGPDRLSYRELNERANRLAHYLQAQKVGPEVLVAIYMTRSLDMLVAILAVLKAGGAYVPLDPAYPQERLAFILEDTQAPLLLTQRSLLTNLPSHTALVICLDDLRIPPDLPVTNPDRQAAAHNLLYIIYTSGSTGRPKGVAITHSSAIALVNWAGSVFPAEALHTVLAATSICFDLSLFEFFVPLSQGGTVVLVETILDLPELPSDHQITLINTVPSAIRQLLEAGGVPDSVRYINLAGEALSTALVDDIYRQTQVTHVHDLYGPSEDTTYSTFTLRQPAGPATIGQPITNTKAYLLNSQLKPVPVGVPGEIYLGGAGLARGYYNRPKITAERFIPHPFSSEPGARLYRTGDLARYRPDGNIEFLGRIDHQVKIRGYRIELGEIETVLRQHPDIEEVVCLAREDNPGDKRLVAYLVATTAGEPIASADLRQYLAAQLPQYMVPNLFMWLDTFPLTPNGKVNRQKLPVPDVDDLPRATQYIAPRNLQETKLAMLWQDILGVEQAGVHDNFFELGGHSLLATQLVSRIREAFAVEVPLRALFEQPTVAGLSAYIVAAGEQPESQLSTTTPPIIPDPDNEYRPLSFSQQRLWFLNQLDPENTAYHIPMALRLEGDLNEQVLKDSLSEIVRRHESLRMTFDLVDEEGPVQIIHAPAPVEIEVTDLQHLPFADREMEAQRLAAREARRPFNLVDGPLLRVKLYRLSARDTVILLNTHHVISDGWSIGVLVRELATLYTTFLRGLPSPLPDLPVQYSDFARWQHGWFKDAVEEQHLAYWKQQLADAPRRLHLPTDRPRPSVRGHQGRTHPFSINAKLVDKIKNLGRQANATLFMTLLTALSVLLARYSGQKDIVIGSPIANRLRPEVEPLIGFFANTIVFRTQIAGNPTFLALLEQVRQVALGAYAHQSMPFEKLVEDLQPERDMGYAPLFQVMFALQNMLIEETALPGLTIKPFAVENTTAKFDLLLTLIETKDGLQGGLEYNSDLFEAATIERMVKHYEKLLDELIAQPQRPVLDIPLLSREEKQTLLKNWHNGPVIDVPEPYLHQLFEVQAARSPHAVAVQDENQRLTYGQLDKLANRLANKLLSLNVKPGDCVGICLERSVAMVVSLLAVCKAGAAYVPLDPQYPEARLAYMLDNAEASILLTYSGFVDRFSQFSGVAIYLDNNQEDTDIGDEQPSINITPQYPAYVIYTSGSTGKPKGVLVSHTAVCNHLSWRQSRFPLAEGDAFLQKASFGFDISTWEIMAPLVTGARLILARPGGEKDPRYLAEEVARQKITTIHFSPAMLHHFVDVPELDRCVDLKYIFCGGESLTASLQKRVFARLPHVQLLHQYGPTEACIDATIWACDPQDEQPIIPIGRPIANTQVYILDENLEPVPIGVPGELYIGGVGVAHGYLKAPQLTAASFVPDPFAETAGVRLYKTGDMARFRSDGAVEFLGRRDQQVKIRGYRIELGEVQAVLRQQPDIKDAICLAREDKPGDKRLVAYCLLDTETAPSPEVLRTFLQGRLPDYMLPTAFVYLEAFPLTPNGKVNREALPAPSQVMTGETEAYTPPSTAVEVTLADIWSSLLDLPQVGIHDNFFALGGHSLLTIQLVMQIRRTFQVDFPLQLVFEAGTVAQMAALIAAEQDKQKQEGVQIGYLERLQHLSPEKRELILKRLRKQGVNIAHDDPTGLAESPLMPVRTEGALPPTFWMHAVDGFVFSYMELAAELDARRPFYGLKSIGIEGRTQPLTTIQEMAAAYVQAITGVQPEGPFHLGGWSMGGVIAFEVAQQLQQAGHQVAMLALIDSYVPQVLPVPDELDNAALLFAFIKDLLAVTGRDLVDVLANFPQLGWQEQVELVLTMGKESGFLPPNANKDQLHQYLKLFRTNHTAFYKYRPAHYNGRILLFQATESTVQAPPDHGWAELVEADKVDVYSLAANHHTILQAPAVNLIAGSLNKLLEPQRSSS